MGSLENGTHKAREEQELEQEQEPILVQQSQRFCMFPIRYKQIWEMYKKAEASFWTGTYIFSHKTSFISSFNVILFLKALLLISTNSFTLL